MVADYGYPNARIRGMKSHLFDSAFYEKLIEEETLQDVLTVLGKTPYGSDIDQAMVKYRGIKGVDEGLRRNIMRTFRKIYEIAEKDARRLVTILVGRWDVTNIKTILRGKNIGASDDLIKESLIPAGELDESLLHEIVAQHDVKSCIDLLATWEIPYARPLTENFPEYAKRRSLTPLELALDKFYYEDALRKLKRHGLNAGLVREILIREIDFTNIMTVLRIVREEVEPKEAAKFLIPGGKELPLERLKGLIEKASVEDVVYELQDTMYYEVLSKKLETYFETTSLSVLERSMEEMIVRKGVSMFRGDPLSIALIIGYVWAKYNEVVNLRIIARGKAVGMPEERIREALVLA